MHNEHNIFKIFKIYYIKKKLYNILRMNNLSFFESKNIKTLQNKTFGPD